MPAAHKTAIAPQPLQHLAVTPAAPEDDLLAMKLAGQFALESGDVARAASEFAKAAARSDDPTLADEAVEVAKRFGAEQGHTYVNGVLDKLARAWRATEHGAASR